jgi:hypothetical protein
MLTYLDIKEIVRNCSNDAPMTKMILVVGLKLTRDVDLAPWNSIK